MKKTFANTASGFKKFIQAPEGKVICSCAVVLIAGAVVLTAMLSSRQSAPVNKITSSTTSSYSVAPVISASSVSIDKKSLTLNVGETATLNAKVLPDSAADSQVSWSSSDKTVVSVVDGGIVAQQAGTAEVLATACNGKKAVCTVLVNAKPAAVSAASSTPAKAASSAATTKPSAPQTSSKAATIPAAVPGKASSSGKSVSSTSGSHVPVPTTQAEHYKTIGGNTLDLNTTAHGIQIQVDTSSVTKHGELNVKVYENNVLNSSMSGYYGIVSTAEKTVPVVFGVDCYYKYGYYWTKAASYKVECYVGDTLFQTITFSVNENGFKS